MGKIHGTLIDEEKELRKLPAPPMIPHVRPDIMTPMTPMMPRGSFGGGAFDGNYQVLHWILYSCELQFAINLLLFSICRAPKCLVKA